MLQQKYVNICAEITKDKIKEKMKRTKKIVNATKTNREYWAKTRGTNVIGNIAIRMFFAEWVGIGINSNLSMIYSFVKSFERKELEGFGYFRMKFAQIVKDELRVFINKKKNLHFCQFRNLISFLHK